MYRGAKMTAPKVARGSSGGRQGVARGSSPLRHPKNLPPTPKKSSHGDHFGAP